MVWRRAWPQISSLMVDVNLLWSYGTQLFLSCLQNKFHVAQLSTRKLANWFLSSVLLSLIWLPLAVFCKTFLGWLTIIDWCLRSAIVIHAFMLLLIPNMATFGLLMRRQHRINYLWSLEFCFDSGEQFGQKKYCIMTACDLYKISSVCLGTRQRGQGFLVQAHVWTNYRRCWSSIGRCQNTFWALPRHPWAMNRANMDRCPAVTWSQLSELRSNLWWHRCLW